MTVQEMAAKAGRCVDIRLTPGPHRHRVLPVNPPLPFGNLEKALAAADAGDTFTTDANGKAVRDEPMSDEAYAAWEKSLDERVTVATPSL